MNYTRIEKDFYFQAALHFENKFYVNVYDLTLSILVETTSPHEQTTAMDRAVHFMDNSIKNCLFVYGADQDAIEKYHIAGIRICELPEEPYDQLVGMVLMQKLNSIMEGRLKITDLVISSIMSDGVRYSLVSEVTENLLHGDFWWNKADTTLCNAGIQFCSGNVVKLFEDDEWCELGLSWKEKAK